MPKTCPQILVGSRSRSMTVCIINWTVSSRPNDLISVMITLGVGVGVGVDVGVLVGVGVHVAVPVGMGVRVTVGVRVGVDDRTVGKALVAVGKAVAAGVAAFRGIRLRPIIRIAPAAMATATRAKSTISGTIHLLVLFVTGTCSFVVARPSAKVVLAYLIVLYVGKPVKVGLSLSSAVGYGII